MLFDSRFVYPLCTLVSVALFWEVLVRTGMVPDYVLPRASEVGEAMVTRSHEFLPQAWSTVQGALLGFVVSIGIGLPLAMLLAASRTLERSVYPLLVSSQVVPKIALGPLFVIWLGSGISSKVVIAFLIAFFPVVVAGFTGFKSIEVEKLYLARSMGTGPMRTFFSFRLPRALPEIFGGLKVSAAFATTGAVIGEFIAADRGLGRMILAASSFHDVVTVFGALMYLMLIGLMIVGCVFGVERIALRWQFAARQSR